MNINFRHVNAEISIKSQTVLLKAILYSFDHRVLSTCEDINKRDSGEDELHLIHYQGWTWNI